MDSPWFSGAASLRTYCLEELLGTKLRALYQRKEGRDLLDLALALQRRPDLDVEKTVGCFLAICGGQMPGCLVPSSKRTS